MVYIKKYTNGIKSNTKLNNRRGELVLIEVFFLRDNKCRYKSHDLCWGP